ncbi:unnamed protein product [Amoebophrya sp. A120]|nr:unnamed protein product [Amoebophrya sp. A120]|eukprot:GSA120T00024507001.1
MKRCVLIEVCFCFLLAIYAFCCEEVNPFWNTTDLPVKNRQYNWIQRIYRPQSHESNGFVKFLQVVLLTIVPKSLTWITLCNNFVPISLVVQLQLNRLFQVLFLVKDDEFLKLYEGDSVVEKPRAAVENYPKSPSTPSPAYLLPTADGDEDQIPVALQIEPSVDQTRESEAGVLAVRGPPEEQQPLLRSFPFDDPDLNRTSPASSTASPSSSSSGMTVTTGSNSVTGEVEIGDISSTSLRGFERPQVNRSNLLEELGHITHIVTDKTGTLTKNEMSFHSSFGFERGTEVRSGEECTFAMLTDTDPPVDDPASPESSSSSDSSSLFATLLPSYAKNANSFSGDPASEEKLSMFLAMALCHTCERDLETGNLSSASPEEIALVEAAENCVGIEFLAVRDTDICAASCTTSTSSSSSSLPSCFTYDVRIPFIQPGVSGSDDHGVEHDNLAPVISFEIAKVLEFNSDRRRMSIVVKIPETLPIPKKPPDRAESPVVILNDDTNAAGSADSVMPDRHARANEELPAQNKYPADYVLICKGADSVLIDDLSLTSRNADKQRGPCEKTQNLKRKIKELSETGLRTLVFGWKKLDAKEVASLFSTTGCEGDDATGSTTVDADLTATTTASYTSCSSSSASSQARRVESAARKSSSKTTDDLEKDLHLLSAVAIEDALANHVAETVDVIKKAEKIKLWVCTGDKPETAVAVAKSCHIVDESMEVWNLNDESSLELPNSVDCYASSFSTYAAVVTGDKFCQIIAGDSDSISFSSGESEIRKKAALLSPAPPPAVGKKLHVAQAEVELLRSEKNVEPAAHRKINQDLQNFLLNATAVIISRVSPKQKREVVRFLQGRNIKGKKGKTKLKNTVLAIGDGANDAGMIKEATVGIGLYDCALMKSFVQEQEDSCAAADDANYLSNATGTTTATSTRPKKNPALQTAAVRQADFACGHFACLQRLIFVHGREAHRRNAFFLQFMVYKNVICTVPFVLFGFLSNEASGYPYVYPFLYSMFNTVFTGVGVFAFAVFDHEDYAAEAEQHDRKNRKCRNSMTTSTPATFISWDQKLIYNCDKTYNKCVPSCHAKNYKHTRRERTGYINPKLLSTWLLLGVFHSVIIHFLVFEIGTVGTSNFVLLNNCGLLAFGLMILLANFTLLFCHYGSKANNCRYLNGFVLFGCLFGFFLYLPFYVSHLETGGDEVKTVVGIADVFAGRVSSWYELVYDPYGILPMAGSTVVGIFLPFILVSGHRMMRVPDL